MSTQSDHPPVVLSRAALWRSHDFRLLWIGHTVSMFGSQITPVAVPLLAALMLNAGPAEMAVLLALQYAPATLVSLFAGVLVDRIRRRPLMIATDLLSAALLAVIPLAVPLGWLSIELLYIVTFCLGVVGVFYGIADSAFLPTVVMREHLTRANGALATSSSAARIVGPGLGGMFVQWLTAPLALLIDAASFVISALSAACIQTPEPAPPRPEHLPNMWREIAEGLGTIAFNPYLRTFALSSAALDLFWNALYAVYVLYITRELSLPPATIGLVLSVGSITALVSAPLAAPVASRVGLGRMLIGCQVIIGGGSLLIALAMLLPSLAFGLIISAEVVQVSANTVFYIARESIRQAVTPDRLRGRVGASTMCIGLGVALLGTALGGVLGERVGVPTVIVIGAVGGAFSFLWLVFSPVRRLHNTGEVPS